MGPESISVFAGQSVAKHDRADAPPTHHYLAGRLAASNRMCHICCWLPAAAWESRTDGAPDRIPQCTTQGGDKRLSTLLLAIPPLAQGTHRHSAES